MMPFDGEEFGNAVADLVKGYVDREIKKLRQEFEGRLDAAHSAISYRGVWEQDAQYMRGNFVSFRGSLWHANETTRSRPGDGGPAWSLAVKAGRDGKDLR